VEAVPDFHEGARSPAQHPLRQLRVLRHRGEALDTVRKSEYARLSGKDRRFIKEQKYTLLSSCENLTLQRPKSHKLALHDTATEAALQLIFELDPHFVRRDEERSRLLPLAARLIGARAPLRLYKIAKRFI